jgi:hypothetical protein
MREQRNKAAVASERILELRAELARRIAFYVGPAEKRITDVPGLLFVRRTGPTAPESVTCEPSLAVVAQGRKRADLGPTAFIFDESRFLLTSLDLPVVSQVLGASEKVPYLCLLLRLEMSVVRELLSREELQAPEATSDSPAMATGEITPELLGACCRLVELLDHPQDIRFLSGLIQREIIYRILQAPAGTRLRAIATLGDQSPHGKSGGVDQDELRPAAAGGRTRKARGHGCIHAPQSFPGVNCYEPASVPEATSAASSAGPHAHRWS